jgi:hypothetical protein
VIDFESSINSFAFEDKILLLDVAFVGPQSLFDEGTGLSFEFDSFCVLPLPSYEFISVILRNEFFETHEREFL